MACRGPPATAITAVIPVTGPIATRVTAVQLAGMCADLPHCAAMRSRLSAHRALPLAAICAPLLLGACAPDEPSDWGYVKLQFQKGDQSESPYPGTAEVTVTVQYLTCLSDFFDAKPQYRMDGVDGGDVYYEWQDRLCSIDNSGHPEVECQVKDMIQRVGEDAGDANTLQIVYTAMGPVQDNVVLIGPLPTEELAGCVPVVRVIGASGANGSGTQIWRHQSFPEPQAATGQRLPMRVTAQGA